jgi:hypothetical protein
MLLKELSSLDVQLYGSGRFDEESNKSSKRLDKFEKSVRYF